MKYEEKIAIVPVWEKCTLTVEEATAYTGIGNHKLCELSEPNCQFVLWVGNKGLFKRKKLDEFLEKSQSV